MLTLELGTIIAEEYSPIPVPLKLKPPRARRSDGVSVNNTEYGTIQVDTFSFDGKLVVEGGTTITDGILSIGSLGLF